MRKIQSKGFFCSFALSSTTRVYRSSQCSRAWRSTKFDAILNNSTAMMHDCTANRSQHNNSGYKRQSNGMTNFTINFVHSPLFASVASVVSEGHDSTFASRTLHIRVGWLFFMRHHGDTNLEYHSFWTASGQGRTER